MPCESRQAAKSGAFKAGSTPRGTEHANEEVPGQGVQADGRPQAPPRPKGLRSTGELSHKIRTVPAMGFVIRFADDR